MVAELVPGRPGTSRWVVGKLREERPLVVKEKKDQPGQPVDAPTAERLSYVEGLRLQSAPQLGDPDFVDHRNPVRGGIPAHSAVSAAAQRGFNRFARRYPHLAQQERSNPGRSARSSYARETGGAHALLGEGLEPVDENATQTASEEVEDGSSSSSSAPTHHTDHQDNQTEFSEATLTHTPTSVWYSVDEEETEEATEQERSLIHPSNVPKPPTYNGKKEEWEKFKHIFTAWSSTVHGKYPELLEKYGAAKDPSDEAAFTEEEDRLAKAMYTFLMQYCPEPTMNVIGQGLHDANGFEIWRRLVRLSEPSYRTKAWVWRKHLSNPNFPSDIATWSTALHQWESELREYERMFRTSFSEDEKVSILAHASPKELQQSIFMHSDALNSYSKMRNYIEQHLVNKNVWKRPQGSQFGLTRVTNKVDDGGPMPMDIGGVSKGKGSKGDKGKGKGAKGKGSYDQSGKGDKAWKWQNSDKGTGKGKTKGSHEKGKGQEKGKGGKGKSQNEKGSGKGGQVNNPDAGKQCHVCKKFGHVAADCWWKVGAMENSTPAKEQTASSTGGSGAVGAVSDLLPSPNSMIFTVGESRVSAVSKTGNTRCLLVDSGACESVAKQGESVPLELHRKRWYLKVQHFAGSASHDGGSPSGNHPEAHCRVAQVEAGQKIEEEKEPDEWRREKKDGKDYLIRVHNTPRFQLFSPSKMKELPGSLHSILPGRLTKMVFSENGEQAEDESLWTSRGTASKSMGKEWLGESWFLLKEDEEDETAEEIDERELMPAGMVNAEAAQEESLRLLGKGARREKGDAESDGYEPSIASTEDLEKAMDVGQGKDKHQKRKEESKEHIIYSDYLFFNKDGHIIDKETGLKQKGLVTVLTAICKDSQFPFAIVVLAKGGNEYAIKALITWIEELGWDRATIQVDQENSLHKLYDEVKKRMPEKKVKLRKSPRYSSQSLADGEMVKGLIAGKVRFHINKSRTTPYRIISGAEYTGELIPLGETVMAKFPRAAHEKSAPRWTKGIYGGKTSSSDEYLVLTESVAQKYRTVRRLPVGSQYQKETFDKMRGAPWNAVLGITKSKPDAVVSRKALVLAPELASEEVYDFKEKPEKGQPLAIEIPAPMVRFREGKREDRKEPKEAATSSKESKMTVDDEGPTKEKRLRLKSQIQRKVKAEAARSGSAAASAGLPERYDIATPEDAPMSRRSTVEAEEPEVSTAQDMIAAVAQNGEWRYAGEKRKTGGHYDKIHEYKRWLEKNGLQFIAQLAKGQGGSFFGVPDREGPGDSKGQPVMMKPPQEWLEDYDVWLASQPKEIQDELKDVPASEIVWQVDGNLYGRQSAAVQYRDRLEEY
ncbi:unnamed protein product [Cladocopium goreaui]|uniref:Retrovirus-related Pol polyprotein from transposon TNT 1-94 n=1 Tax=Cladocopium goreaui TaxID=2562237 RepID=A0A9P1DSW2_9DINO|nr:unnamed protein product [Cladocopium goreaui]